MSKRARITLSPSVETQPNRGPEPILADEKEDRPVPGPSLAPSPRPAVTAPAEKTLSAGMIVKVVLTGLVVVAAVLLLRRKP